MKPSRKFESSPRIFLSIGVAISAGFIFGAQSANAAERLYYPYVSKGEMELEYFGSRSVDGDSGKDNKQKHQFSAGYGVNDWWKTEFYGKFGKAPEDKLTFNEWEWENIFQLTGRGEHWLDAGASLAYEWSPQSDHADAIEARLLFAKDLNKTSHTLNMIAEKQVGSGPREALEGKLLWGSRYIYSPYFEPGFEIESDFGELKRAGSFDDQKHYIGPAAYGKIGLRQTGKGGALKYRAGYLFGVSDAASDGQAIIQLEYEMYF